MVTAEVTPNRCAAELLDTIPTIMRFLKNRVKEHTGSAASLQQVGVLGYLSMHPGSSLSKVAEHLGVSNATASVTVDRLVQRNLIERSEHPHERRFVELKLTNDGAAHFQEIHQFAESKAANTLSSLPPAKVLKVIEAMAILKEAFTELESK